MRKVWLQVLLILSMTLVSAMPAMAQDQPTPDSPTAGPKIYIPFGTNGSMQQRQLTPAGVPLVEDEAVVSAASASPKAERFHAASVIVELDGSTTLDTVAASVNGQVVHRYKNVFDGGSMIVPDNAVGTLTTTPGVTKVYLDKVLQLDTDTSPTFIGATNLWQALGGKGKAGEGVVVGILDTGIWPEHPSLSDPDPYGKRYPAPPISGLPCDFGNTAYNPNDKPFTCNNKLIGAYELIDSYKANTGLLPTEFDSARDDNGHGTHTATTAAGNGGVTAKIYDRTMGRISGIAPRAQIIAYRVCGAGGCYSSDSLAAIDQAIADKVNVINFSISGGASPYGDAVEQGFLAAYNAGIFVAASAGNSGPTLDTTDHRGPWVTTVAASTSDRNFLSTVTLVAPSGAKLKVTGASVTRGITKPTPVVYDPANVGCLVPPPTINPAGAIFLCTRGGIARVEKGYNVQQAGGGGMILMNPTPQDIDTDNHFIPSVHIDKAEADKLIAFMTANPTGVTATFPDGKAQHAQGDVMAAFSSRGGPAQTLGISKPDVTAPGVQILAGHTPLPATSEGGYPGQLFQAIQGTSMSSPHVAGAAALLKDMHPDWTPGQIKSALMMSAKFYGVVNNDGTPAGPFDMGSGRIDLSRAGWVPFTISDTGANFMTYKDALWKANYPSLYIPEMPGRVTVERTLHNESKLPQVWGLRVQGAPSDLKISVPPWVSIPPRGDAKIKITVDASTVPQGEVRSAVLAFTFGPYALTFPVTIVRGQADVAVTKTCAPTDINRNESTTCTVTLTNNSFSAASVKMTDRVPSQLRVDGGTVAGGATVNGNTVAWSGSLAGQSAPIVTASYISPDLSTSGGYLPLSMFSGTTDITSLQADEAIANFNVPAFVYAGETYTKIGIVSNGYIVVGGGTGADVNFINSGFPDANLPNNVLAPFWTDLNLTPGEGGGRVLINVLTDNVRNWIVVDWEGAQNYADHAPNTFQVWIGVNGVEDITYEYDAVSQGQDGYLTVGAENKYGTEGQAVYVDGAGTPPSSAVAVLVSSTPGAPGESKVITFQAKGVAKGPWTNCAEVTGDIFENTGIACSSGTVKR